RAGKQLAENFDLLLQLLVRNWLDEFLRRQRCGTIKLLQLRGRSARNTQHLAFRAELAHHANRLSLARVKTAAGEQQVANQRKFESPAECYPVNGSDSSQRGCVDRVHHAMNALQKFARALDRFIP